MLEGRLAVEIEGQEHMLTPLDKEISVKRWSHHRLCPPPPTESCKKTVFLLSGEDVAAMYRLDTNFFLNWYAYQDQVVAKAGPISIIQTMCVSSI